MSEFFIVMVTAPDASTAGVIAAALVDDRLAACVNIVSGCRSVYRWEGKITEDDEVLMLIKTRRARFDDLVSRVTALHPYDVPEVVALSPEAISPAYREFLDDNTE